MKILVVCQHYAPEPVRLPDICEEWVHRGHEVDVITGVPNYPMGYIYDGYKKRKNRNENINGVSVHRCFTIGRRKGILFRFLNYLNNTYIHQQIEIYLLILHLINFPIHRFYL